MKLLFRQIPLFKKLMLPLVLLGGTIVMGTLGYMIIEGFSFLDALYMTVITIGSVGYSEVHPLSDAGRVFTIFLIIINIGLITYFITLLSRYLLDGEFLKQYKQIKMIDAIAQLKQHVIICGLGRNGRECAQVLHENNIPYVVIEEKEAATKEDTGFNIPFLIKGDATKDEVLLEAGIKNARALIATLPIDADNLFVVLTAKQINPQLTIISRASQDSSVSKLKIGGASNVIMPDKIGGAHMATLVMIPDVVELMSLLSATSNEQFKIVELEVTLATPTPLQQLNLWQETGCTVLSVKNSANNYLLNPGPAQAIAQGDRLIIMGSAAQIEVTKRKI
jgi:voltage-gated potassium channel